jgi:hypothetical protein
MMMVKEVLIYSSIALFIFFFVELCAGRFTDGPIAECRADQFCGGYVTPNGYVTPIPPQDPIAIFPNDEHYGEK